MIGKVGAAVSFINGGVYLSANSALLRLFILCSSRLTTLGSLLSEGLSLFFFSTSFTSLLNEFDNNVCVKACVNKAL